MVERNLCDPPALDYLRALTSEIGIWQHAQGKTPDRAHGYSIDDVARALIVVNMTATILPKDAVTSPKDSRTLEDLGEIYLGFLERAQRPDGQFHNFFSADGHPLDDVGSPDSFGRTIWALGHTIHHGITEEQRNQARALFDRARQHVRVTPFLRTNAFLILGLVPALRAALSIEDIQTLSDLVRDILERFERYRQTDWHWFEDSLRYSNGLIPLALTRAAPFLNETSNPTPSVVIEAATTSLDFLLAETVDNDVPLVIGNKGWYEHRKDKARYDQQPVDAAAMVLACLAAWKATSNDRYRSAAETWLRWYDGKNMAGAALLEDDGAVHDGINGDPNNLSTPLGINPNCGAESVVTYLLARLRWIDLCCGTSSKGTLATESRA